MNAVPEIADALLDPAVYPWSPGSVARIDTHLSMVFLAGDRVVKVKRPVDFGFVDFRSLEARRESCEEEVRLNSYLTSNVYLSVSPITCIANRLTVGGNGPAIDWATVMRRLPADGMLDHLIGRGETPAHLGKVLAGVLIPFHQSRAATCNGNAAETERAASTVVTENIAQLRPFAGRILDTDLTSLVTETMESFMRERRDLLVDRAAHGWIREGHGDLRAEHVCIELNGAVQIFDCVEFSKAIRCADVASDLAFLLMDLKRLGERAVADQLLEHYRAAGLDLPDDLVRFYMAHRALVRTKVACLRMTAIGDADREDLIREATGYLGEATAATTSAGPSVIAVTGLSGTGKSTVARALGGCLGVEILSSDRIRKELAGVRGSAVAEWEQGIYATEWTDRTYRELAARASDLLRRGHSVILDASYLESDRRVTLAALSEALGVPLAFVEVTCEQAKVEQRLRERSRSGSEPSDATVEIYRAQLVKWGESAKPRLPGVQYLSVDTSSQAPPRIGKAIRTLADSGVVQFRI